MNLSQGGFSFVISGPGHVSRPTRVARCWRGHTCPYYARNCCWFRHDDDGEGSACAATARAATPLPPASLLVRLSSLVEQIAEVLKVIPQELFPAAHCGADRRRARPAGGVCWRMGRNRGADRKPCQCLRSRMTSGK